MGDRCVCTLQGSGSLIWVTWAVVLLLVLLVKPTQEEQQYNEESRLRRSLADLERQYSEDELSNIYQPRSRQKRFIYFGTKWCGDGNSASGYDDLGSKRELDMCCRDHDHCNYSISAGNTKFGLHNPDKHTRTHCDCDDVFRQCLAIVGGIDAGIVANIFFGVTTCFRFDHPANCTDRSSETDRCLEYTFDKTKPKVWQFFDPLPWNYKLTTPTPTLTPTTTAPTTPKVGSVTSRASSSLAVGSISTVSILAFLVTILVCKKVKDNGGFCRGGVKYKPVDTCGAGEEVASISENTQNSLKRKLPQVNFMSEPLPSPVKTV